MSAHKEMLEPSSKRARRDFDSLTETDVELERDKGTVSGLETLFHKAAKTRLQDFRPVPPGIFVVNNNIKLRSLFPILFGGNRNIQRIPVTDNLRKYHGFIGIKEVLRCALNSLYDTQVSAADDLEKIFVSSSPFLSTAVGELMDAKFGVHPFRRVTSLFGAWEFLAIEGMEKLPVVDRTGDFVDVISQSMLINFLWTNIEILGSLAELKVSSILTDKLILVPSDMKAIAALQLMIRDDIEEVGVVNAEGRLHSRFSYQNVQGLTCDAKGFFKLWDEPVESFTKENPKTQTTVLMTDTIYEVIERMAFWRLRSIFVLESQESMRPIQVITETSLLQYLINLLQTQPNDSPGNGLMDFLG